MAVFKNCNNDELIISCKCGCDDGVHLSVTKDDEEYAFITFTNGNFYKEQKSPIITKLKKIWAIIRNKDYYYSDIIMSKSEFEMFVDWIKNKDEREYMTNNLNKRW